MYFDSLWRKESIFNSKLGMQAGRNMLLITTIWRFEALAGERARSTLDCFANYYLSTCFLRPLFNRPRDIHTSGLLARRYVGVMKIIENIKGTIRMGILYNRIENSKKNDRKIKHYILIIVQNAIMKENIFIYIYMNMYYIYTIHDSEIL